MAYEYIKDDLLGYPFNSKYPPNYDRFGHTYHGYRNGVEEVFFYEFAVQRYDLYFAYNGKEYYFVSETEYTAQCAQPFNNIIKMFKDGNDVLEKFEIDGMKLIDLIPLIKDCEAM